MTGTWITTPYAREYDGDDTNETVKGGSEIDHVFGAGGDDNVSAGKGADYVDGGLGSDTLNGGDDNDQLVDIDVYSDIPSGYSGLIGRDTLHGGNGDDLLYFESPDTGDVADGGGGSDTLRIDFTAYNKNDPISADISGPSSVAQVNHINTVALNSIEQLIYLGGNGADFVTGGALDDQIQGRDGNDTLRGGDGDDNLDGGRGVQNIDGGAGNDTAAFDASDATAALHVTSGTTINLGASGKITNVENLSGVATGIYDDVISIHQTAGVSISSGAGADTITVGDGGSAIYAGEGDDSVKTGKGADFVDPGNGTNTVHLGAGNDSVDFHYEGRSITPTDTIYGEDGNDSIQAAAGVDTLDGGAGNDTIAGGDGDDILTGGAGDDLIEGERGADHISGGDGKDIIDVDFDHWMGGYDSANDVVDGGAGDDTITAGFGADTVDAGAGNDTISLSFNSGGIANQETFDSTPDKITGGDGVDTLSLWEFSYQDTNAMTIKVGASSTLVKVNATTIDTLQSVERLDVRIYGEGDHHITGGAYDDQISTESGDDVISAGAGNDSINADTGSDTVTAGDGNDYVSLEVGDKDKVTLGSGNDTLAVTGRLLGYNLPVQTDGGTYDGGSGSDTLTIDLRNSALTDVSFDGTTLKSGKTVLGTFTDFEAVTVSGAGPDAKITGGAGADHLTGGIGDDKLTGGAGDDIITGGGGKDVLSGGKGNDVISSGIGAATITGGSGNDQISAVADATSHAKIDGGTGQDSLYFQVNASGAGPVVVSGDLGTGAKIALAGTELATIKGIEALTISGSSGDDSLIGGSGADHLFANGGADHVTSGAGDDYVGVTIDAGKDVIALGDGTDTLSAGLAGDGAVTMSGTLAHLSIALDGVLAEKVTSAEQVDIYAGGGDDVLFGGALADSLYAGGGKNSLTGGAGDDSLSVTIDAGKDSVSGGDGDDTLNLSGGADGFVMTTKSGGGIDVTVGGALAVHATSIESLYVYGSAGKDTLVGLAGDDTLFGGDGADKIKGNDGDDYISAGGGDDHVSGGKGDDSLSGGDGKDVLDGGAGTDTASYYDKTAAVAVTLDGSHAVTVTVGGVAEDSLSNIENLQGGSGDDQLTGDAGDNLIAGGAGANVLDGGAGIDTVSFADHYAPYTNGQNLTLTLSGSDWALASFDQLGDNSIRNFENVIGTSYADTITGDKNANELTGGYGNDVLAGAGGDDMLSGGYGVDVLTGGSGHDQFVFDNLSAMGDVDSITDFSVKSDKIVLASTAFAALHKDGDVGLFVVGHGSQGANDHIVYDGASGALSYDADGKGGAAAVEFATVTPGLALTDHSFMVA